MRIDEIMVAVMETHQLLTGGKLSPHQVSPRLLVAFKQGLETGVFQFSPAREEDQAAVVYCALAALALTNANDLPPTARGNIAKVLRKAATLCC